MSFNSLLLQSPGSQFLRSVINPRNPLSTRQPEQAFWKANLSDGINKPYPTSSHPSLLGTLWCPQGLEDKEENPHRTWKLPLPRYTAHHAQSFCPFLSQLYPLASAAQKLVYPKLDRAQAYFQSQPILLVHLAMSSSNHAAAPGICHLCKCMCVFKVWFFTSLELSRVDFLFFIENIILSCNL
jgi:hypothetical protein